MLRRLFQTIGRWLGKTRMFIPVVEVGPDLIFDYDNVSMGTVRYANGNELTITDDSWAPGIWAGMEGFPIIVGNVATIVSRVDLDRKIIWVEYNGEMEIGAVIKYGTSDTKI